MATNPRDHGYGDAPRVSGAPRVGDRVPDLACPHCRCTTVFEVEVEVASPPPMLRRPEKPHRVVGRYVGCPACPWASPMITSCKLLPEPMTPEETEREIAFHRTAAMKARTAGDEVSACEHEKIAAQLQRAKEKKP